MHLKYSDIFACVARAFFNKRVPRNLISQNNYARQYLINLCLFLKRQFHNNLLINLPYLPLIAWFLCRKVVPFPALKVPVVFHQIRYGFLLAALPPRRCLGESQAEEAAVVVAVGGGGGAVTAAVAVAALQAVGGAQAAQGNQQVAADKSKGMMSKLWTRCWCRTEISFAHLVTKCYSFMDVVNKAEAF